MDNVAHLHICIVNYKYYDYMLDDLPLYRKNKI